MTQQEPTQKQNTIKKKRKINLGELFAILLLLIGLPIAGATIAYYSVSIEADNFIQFGSVKLDLLQTTLDEKGEEIYFDSSVDFDVTNAASQSRIVRVKNVGNHSLYLRVKMILTSFSENGESFVGDEYVDYTLNKKDWIYQDGWYYYTKIVDPDDSTTELMTEVIFEVDELVNIYPDSSFHLDIYAQGVQSENNIHESVLDVEGWPEE